MDEHQRNIVKVSDWLADGWDWDMIGAALGLDPEEASRRYAVPAEEHARAREQRSEQ